MSNEYQPVPLWYFRLWVSGHVLVFATPFVMIAIMDAKQFVPTWPVTILVFVILGHIAYILAGVVLLHGRRIEGAVIGFTAWLICLPVWGWAIVVLLQNGD